MAEADTSLDAMLRRLAHLPPRDRSAILSLLPAEQAEQVSTLLSADRKHQAQDRSAEEGLMLQRLSPWLRNRIVLASDKDGNPFTPAVARAILETIEADGVSKPKIVSANADDSLIGRLNGFLAKVAQRS